MKKVEDYVRTIPDFPEKGIMFRDVTSVMQDPEGLQLAINGLNDLVKDVDYDVVVGPESRGFIFGVPIAYKEKKPFVPVRKKGKLPLETISQDYDLEYGSATIEMHKDAIKPGDRVVIIDDLVATGGTAGLQHLCRTRELWNTTTGTTNRSALPCWATGACAFPPGQTAASTSPGPKPCSTPPGTRASTTLTPPTPTTAVRASPL